MRWLLRNFFGGLLLFPANALLVLLAAWLARKRWPRLARALALAGGASLLLLSMTAVSVPLIRRIELACPALDLNDPKLASRADAIVVLGAGRALDAREYGRDMVAGPGFLRLRYGVDIERRTGKPILVSGGAPDGSEHPEATLMAQALEQSFGVRAKWIEDRSINTAENAELSHAILAPLGIRRIFLVTHAFHMGRALRTFQKVGFEVVPAPMGYLSDRGVRGGWLLELIPSGAGVDMSSVYFHEAIGGFWYFLTGAT